MSGFGYAVDGGAVTRLSPEQAAASDAAFVWLHLEATDDTTRDWLADALGFDAYLLDALTAVETRPRCDAVGAAALVNLRGSSAQAVRASEPLASIRMVASAGRVASVARRPLDALPPVVAAIEAGVLRDPGDLIAAIAAAITEHLDPQVADLGDRLDDCEEHLDEARVIELRREVKRTRAQAIGYRRFLSPQRAALERLAAMPFDWLNDDDRLHLASAADRAARMAEEVESIRERSALLHESLTDIRAEQIDQRALTISVVAMVFLPLTFLTGLLGMNVQGIPFADRPWAFQGVVVMCVVTGALIAGYFSWRHWFRR